MQIISDLEQMQGIGLRSRLNRKKLALVPTMGFFHEGHLSLIRWARENADQVVVSLFVNPAQFSPGEDLDQYPSDVHRDMQLARSLGVDYFFMPEADDLYPHDFDTWVETPGLSKNLCGQSRPSHFRGVATIVCKLFNLTMPYTAVFGLKDRQQLMVIKRMVRDLNWSILIEGRPTIREHDGLAMSSRNAYLTPVQRESAANIYKGLVMTRNKVLSGKTYCKELEDQLIKYYLENIPGSDIDYVRIVSLTLERVSRAGHGHFLAVAVKLGRARLIDNIDLY
jgi:pantoate--beta-alanine ligase